MRSNLLFLLLLFIALSVQAQQDLSFKQIDENTLTFYNQSKWDSLINLGRQAEKQGVNYYYLNYRMGVAYFYKNNFFQAQYYLQKALKQNKTAWNDPFFRELLHLCFVYTKRSDLAQDAKLPSNSKILDPMQKGSIIVVGGYGASFGFSKEKQKSKPTIASYEYRQESVIYYGFAANYQFNSLFGIGVSYSRLNFDMIGNFSEYDSSFSSNYNIYQDNIAFQPIFTLGTNWQLNPVFGLSFSKGTSYGLLDTITREYGKFSVDEKDILAGVNIYRYIRNVKLGINAGFSNFSNKKQIQVGANIVYFPFGNLNLYSYTAASLKVDSGVKSVVFQERIGFRTLPKLWVELEGIFGNMKNYSDFSLGYGYNIPDDMNLLLSGKLIFVKSTNINFYLEGTFARKYTYSNFTDVFNQKFRTKIDYNQWNISGGLIWNF